MIERRPSAQDISWFLDLRSNGGRLDLNPPYQRRSVWSPKDRRFFLETIFQNFPSPPIFLHKTMDDNGVSIFHVVDGKQRLETIIKFVSNEISMNKDFWDPKLAGKKWEDLDTDNRKIFWNYSLQVETLDTSDPTILTEVFDRFNRNSRNLNKQELRHAKYDGWLKKTVESDAEKEEWIKFKVSTKSRQKRMQDTQFISELFLVILEKKIFGFDQDNLDFQYSQYDSPSETKPEVSEDDFAAELTDVKSYLLKIEDTNASVTTFAGTNFNFYSLWSFVVLNRHALPAPEEMAKQYQAFMLKVKEIASDPDIIGTITTASEEILRLALKYYLSTVGATTDLSPRMERNSALKQAILG